MSEGISNEQSNPTPEELTQKELDAEEVVNPVLARLIEEVRNESTKGGTAYDRVHNRHNR